jgi:hypothetical protein
MLGLSAPKYLVFRHFPAALNAWHGSCHVCLWRWSSEKKKGPNDRRPWEQRNPGGGDD